MKLCKVKEVKKNRSHGEEFLEEKHFFPKSYRWLIADNLSFDNLKRIFMPHRKQCILKAFLSSEDAEMLSIHK